MSDTVAFSFDTPKHAPLDVAAIQAAIDAETGTPAGDIAAAAAAPITPPAPPASTPSAQAAAPAPAADPAKTASLEDLKTYKITVDGQELELTEADLKSGHMRHRDYTQKTQQIAAEKAAIAKEREEWTKAKTAYDAELAQIDQFLRDQAAVDAYRAKAFGQPTAPVQVPQIDPNKPLTIDEVAQIARYNAEQVRLDTQRQIEELRQQTALSHRNVVESQENIAKSKLADEINRHINTLVSNNPLLQKFEGIDEELMGMAAKYKPSSLEEAKTRLGEAAERKLAAIKSIVEEQQKATAIAAARLKQTSTEPVGGAPAQARPAGKKLTMDTKDRTTRLQENEAFMRELMSTT